MKKTELALVKLTNQAASPKKITTASEDCFNLKANATPTATGMVPATIDVDPKKFTERSIKCIDPPFPEAHPVALPYNSETILFKLPPLAR